MGSVAFVLSLAVVSTGLTGAVLCPDWSNEQHGGALFRCCHLPANFKDSSGCLRSFYTEFRNDDCVELCLKRDVSSRERRQGGGVLDGMGSGSPPPPPPLPPPGR